MKQAIVDQIESAVKNEKKRKIGLVTFESNVEVFGDGTKNSERVNDGILNEYQSLLDEGSKLGDKMMGKAIGDTHENLLKRVKKMTTAGSTALGPGVSISMAMAAKGTPGSQVVICTDGAANCGVGSVGYYGESNADEFYDKAGQFAQNHGLTINVVSIIGADCYLDKLSKLAELTGGTVERVDPMNLGDNFKEIFALKSIATNVEIKIKLHKALMFRNEQKDNLRDDGTLLVRKLGNVNEDTEITFEYTL